MSWISVDDRLPELRKNVLCYMVTISYICANTSRVLESYRYKMINRDLEVFDCVNRFSKVTHWMPLPEPSKITQDK